MPEKYEQFKAISTFTSWIVLIIFMLVIMGWGMMSQIFVKDRPRQWDFGQTEVTPAQSIYSTVEPPPGAAPKQITPLPEAKPIKPLKEQSRENRTEERR